MVLNQLPLPMENQLAIQTRKLVINCGTRFRRDSSAVFRLSPKHGGKKNKK
jgi:hypothetical protein